MNALHVLREAALEAIRAPAERARKARLFAALVPLMAEQIVQILVAAIAAATLMQHLLLLVSRRRRRCSCFGRFALSLAELLLALLLLLLLLVALVGGRDALGRRRRRRHINASR